MHVSSHLFDRLLMPKGHVERPALCDKVSQIVQTIVHYWRFTGVLSRFAPWSANCLSARFPVMTPSKKESMMRTREIGTPNASRRVDGSLRERVRQAAKQVESKIIMEALEQHRWNRRRAAAALNISYRSLMYKMKSCQLRDLVVVDISRDGLEAGGED